MGGDLSVMSVLLFGSSGFSFYCFGVASMAVVGGGGDFVEGG